MAGDFISEGGLSVSRGGSGERLAVLLHRFGANRAVWSRMINVADKHWPDRWIAPDLRLAAGAKNPLVALAQMQAIDPTARTFDGTGHNAHWESPAQAWDFINNKS